MASGLSADEIRRSAAETADELARLRTDIERRIPPQEFERYKARASALRAEAIQHLLRLASLTAATPARDLGADAADAKKDAPARR